MKKAQFRKGKYTLKGKTLRTIYTTSWSVKSLVFPKLKANNVKVTIIMDAGGMLSSSTTLSWYVNTYNDKKCTTISLSDRFRPDQQFTKEITINDGRTMNEILVPVVGRYSGSGNYGSAYQITAEFIDVEMIDD